MPHHGLARSLWPGLAGFVFAKPLNKRVDATSIPVYPTASRAVWVPRGNQLIDMTGSTSPVVVGGIRFDNELGEAGAVVRSVGTVGDYVTLGTVNADTDSVTAMALVRPDIFTNGGAAGGQYVYLSRGKSGAGNWNIMMLFDPSNSNTPFFSIQNSVPTRFNISSSGPKVTPSAWVHLALVVSWSALTMTAYQNGVQVGQIAITGTAFVTSTVGWRMFNHAEGVSDESLTSRVAYASVRNTAFTTAQVQQEFEFARRLFVPLG
jgi:hypothetical protein